MLGIDTTSVVGMVMAFIISVFVLVLWIWTMVKQLKGKEYVWFVLTLVFSPVLIIYWIITWIKKLD